MKKLFFLALGLLVASATLAACMGQTAEQPAAMPTEEVMMEETMPVDDSLTGSAVDTMEADDSMMDKTVPADPMME